MAIGVLLPMPRLEVADQNGLPYPGAKATFTLAGTSTPVNTYSDSALTTPNSNPVIADSGGRFGAIYLTPGVSVKLVLTTTLDAAIYTQDNIAAGIDAASVDVAGVAGVTLAAGTAVYLATDASGGATIGQWYKADSANLYSSTGAAVVGITVNAISSGATGTIRLSGRVTGLSGLVAGTFYYVGTAGALTATAPTNARLLGPADTTTSLVLTANPPIPLVDNAINDFRLTLESGVPVSVADQTIKATLYLTPYTGNRIALFSAVGAPTIYLTAELSLSVSGLGTGVYDIFAYANVGVPTLEALAWTNPTTRATAIVRTTTGAWTKSGDLTRRYVGTIKTSTGACDDAARTRFVWNVSNRVRRPLLRQETTATWTYTTATIRQANANTANQVEVVVGVAEALLRVKLVEMNANSTGGIATLSTIGEDSTTTGATGVLAHTVQAGAGANISQVLSAELTKNPAVGYHFYAWLEYSAATGTTTWYGAGYGTGLAGDIDC